jgi:lipopolysaccharide/colanic/teichoic acid biosynthesis glycosyltransferase
MKILDTRSTTFRSLNLGDLGKRVLDLSLSTLAVLILLPLLLLLIVLIRLDSPGPVFFRQQRVGKDGKLFTCLKFRTMHHNADQSVHREAIKRFANGEALSDDADARFKLTNDRRVTRVGSLLRRTSLDELPQLFNVLAGDMSLVGPRPAIPYELDFYKDWYHNRHNVKPGITGLWQVYGRSRVDFDEMMRLDVEYATRPSLWLDIKLILFTVPALLLQRGAR